MRTHQIGSFCQQSMRSHQYEASPGVILSAYMVVATECRSPCGKKAARLHAADAHASVLTKRHTASIMGHAGCLQSGDRLVAGGRCVMRADVLYECC